MADFDFVFKVLVLGDSSVGKSSLIKRFHSNVFDQKLPTTIGVDFFIHDMEVDGKKIKVRVSYIIRLTGRFATKSFRYTAVQSIRYVLKLTYSLIFELNLLLMQTL